MRKLKIVSDGTPGGTKLFDADTGEDLNLPITRIVWSCELADAAKAEVTILCPLVQLIGETYIGGKDECNDGLPCEEA